MSSFSDSPAQPSLTGTEPAAAASCLAGGGEMGALMRSIDWSRTPLGPPASWSRSLRNMVGILLANRFPLLLWWGPDQCQLYNDAYRPVLGNKHPRSMGQPARECWTEIWEIIGPLIHTPYNGGPATWDDDIFLEPNRHGFVEETHFTVAYSPVPDESVPSGVGGVLATVHEITQQVVQERRIAALRDLSARSAEGRSAEEACQIAAQALARHPKDVPFALLYLIDADRQVARLAGVAGVSAGEPVSPPVVALADDGAHQRGWPFAEVVRSERPHLVEDLAGRFEAVPPGPWSDPPNRALVLPVPSNIQHRLAGLLVLGISARLEFDDFSRSFCELATTQIATAIANARAREEERRQAEALAALDRAKTIFFSNISHEFRTPLTLLLGPIEDSLRAPHAALQGDDLKTVHRNALRLLRLVNSLLDFSRIEAGRIEAVYEPLDLAALTADLASVFRSAVERAGLRFSVDCRSIEAQVYVDRDMWEKIVLNLLSNALKFTLDGEIAVRLCQHDDHVELSIRDTGAGIPAEELPRLFERFHRGHNARARTQEGTGIGLAMVEELVKLHGGRIDVESRLDAGSTFTISIPTGDGHLPPERIGAARSLAPTSTGSAPFVEEALRWLPNATNAPAAASRDAGATTAGAPTRAAAEADATASSRILIVDDNRDMRDYLCRLLSPHWTVDAAADGNEALATALERPPDLVLSDIMMPGLDGLALLAALRADPRTRTIPIILLSARAGEEAQVEGLEAGADDYLVKPFASGELIARVRAHLELAQVRGELRAVQDRLLDAVEAERARLYDVFTQAPALICSLRGPEHIVEFANPPVLQILGARDLIGRRLCDAVPDVAATGLLSLLDRVYATGQPHTDTEAPVELDWNYDGHPYERCFDFTYRPMRDRDGSIGGVLVHAVDVTERVRDRHERDRFLAAVSHDLRNPVTTIGGMAQLLARQMRGDRAVSPEMLTEGLETIRETSRHLSRMLDELLDVARLHAGETLALDRRPVDLLLLVQRLVSRYQGSTEQHQISFRSEPAGLIGDWDAERLDRAIDNLLSNAVKYSPNGGAIAVELQTDTAVWQAVLTVTDHGIGIPEADLARVLDGSRRGSNVGHISGVGLGLSGARQIAEAHGGSIAVRSREGSGTAVILRLPLDSPSSAQASGAQ